MDQKISFKEKLAYAVGDSGCNFIWTLVGSFLTMYYTDSVGLTAAAVGTLMLVTRLLDGGSDLVAGALIDKTRTRWGKARPWLLFSSPLMMVGVVLLFGVPDSMSDSGKLIYAYITYIFLAVIVYTACNLSYVTLLSLLTEDQQARASASSIRFFLCIVVIIITSYTMNPIVDRFGWKMAAGIFGLIGLILLLITFFGTKERVNVQQNESKMSLKETIPALFKNKYFILIALLFVLTYGLYGAVSGVGLYYARDVLGNVGIFGTLTLLRYAPALPVSIIMPKLVKRYGKWKCIFVGYILITASFALNAAAPRNLPVVLFALFLFGVGQTFVFGLIFAMVADAVDYGEWKTGLRIDGMTYSAVSFGMKVGTGLGTAIVGWVLAMGGYDGMAETQGANAVTSIISLYAYIPLAMSVVALILICFANIDKIYPTIAKELSERKEK